MIERDKIIDLPDVENDKNCAFYITKNFFLKIINEVLKLY